MMALTATTIFAQQVSMTPASGDQDQTFVLGGKNFSPSEDLAVALVSPAGESFPLPGTWVTDGNGEFAIPFVPSTDLAGAQAGTWGAAVCDLLDSTTCWSGTFDISL